MAAEKATEAAEKARIASAKAAAASQEAAQASAEASQAATEAELAIKLSQGASTKNPPRKAAKRPLSKAVAVSSPSPVSAPTSQEKVTPPTTQEKLTSTASADVSSSPPPASNLVSAANAAQDQSIQTEAARLIDQTSSSLKKIARNKLDAQDAERYDVASKLLKNARDSFAAQDFIAAHSLANKAAVLIRPLQAAGAER